MNIRNQLGKRILFFDGGMGTLLQARGLLPGELPETWNLKRAAEIISIHKSYLESGADIILANTFGANGLKFPENIQEIVSAGVKNAKIAIAESGKEAYVALDIGPTGKLLKPMGTLEFEDAVALYKEVIIAGAKAGADLVVIETMSDTYELKAAVLAAKENCDLPVMASVIFGENGKLLTGATPEAVVALLEGLRVDALGVNCGLGPKQMKTVCAKLAEISSIPLMISPNAGLPRTENGQTVFDVEPEEFAADMEELIGMGAWLAGGCCGTTPAHIKALVDKCSHMQPVPLMEKDVTLVSSYACAVEIGKQPVIIGERINPTGKSRFKQALREHNIEYILEEGVRQADAGAHILDVNVGLPEIDEEATMKEVVYELQSILDLPLQIDTSDAGTMEAAMRLYNGKPMVNSVNGKAESMAEIFPLVQKYGGVVVGLTLDESGIPDTVEGRLAIAEKIYATAAEYGIARKDIAIDALTMTMSTSDMAAQTTLAAVGALKARGSRTVLGVSNISFGLPQRELVNTAFFTMALQAGLSAGIINPNAEAMMRAYDAYMVLGGFDTQCGHYVEKYAALQSNVSSAFSKRDAQNNAANVPAEKSIDAPQKAAESISTPDLKKSIIKGLKEQATRATSALLQIKQPLTIINEDIVPALDEVGRGFEKGTVFLPQLLMSAEAAKAAFEILKRAMAGSGENQAKKGTIVLATVKGDIHDIGKNIVKVLLENYAYRVIDLGKDVTPERILEAVKEYDAPLVGLSALMTTTVASMEETIALLRKETPNVKVMVGGAVLTKEYADKIGADFYGKDAMQSVYYAEEIFAWKIQV